VGTEDRIQPGSDRPPDPRAHEGSRTEIAPPAPDGVAVGALVAGRYRIEGILGRGGIGVVYLARDEQLAGRQVALKLLLESAASSDWLSAKFADERQALARLRHPNIVMITDAGALPDGRPFLVMEYVPGPTLRVRLADGALDLTEAATILAQLGRAVDAAHSHGVVHRDLKPENVILQDLGAGECLVKVIDFGVATLAESFARDERTTRAAGTRAYMSPEQLRGHPAPASDVYALATIAYELLTGQRPFSATTDVALLEEQRRGVAERPSAVRPQLPVGCDKLIERGLAFEPDRRPASARELCDGLAGVLAAGEATAIAPSTSARRRYAGRVAAAAALVTLIGVLGAAGKLCPRRSATESVAPSALSGSTIEYTLVVQRYRAGSPYRSPFALPGPLLFAVDDHIRLQLSSPRAGYVYVLNEGPVREQGLPMYNLLFPSASTRGGSARIAAGENVQIPAETWLVFDDEQGTEKLWLVWSAGRVSEIDDVAPLANPVQRGAIQDVRQRRALQRFLGRIPRATASAEGASGERRTRLSAKGETLVSTIELEHR
jgi:serine/threonine protein kinase